MALTLKSKPDAIDPDKVYISWQGFAGPGPGMIAKRGQKFRGSAEIVQRWPHLFVEDGTPESEWPSVYHAAIADDNARAKTRHDALLADAEANRVKFPRPVLLRLTRDATATVAGRFSLVEKGSFFAPDDPLLAQIPDDALEECK
jgi:hypothetical protein